MNVVRVFSCLALVLPILGWAQSSAVPAPKPDTTQAVQAAQPAQAVSNAPTAQAAPVAVVDSAKADTTATVVKDSTAVTTSDSAKVAIPDSSQIPAVATKKTKRAKIVRETSVNTLDDLKGKYRSPKRALFMSLVLPGSGQVYVGGGAFNYARGVTYLLAEASLWTGMHYYSTVRHREQVKKYRRFGDEHWRQKQYEDTLDSKRSSKSTDVEVFQRTNFLRDYYCYSIFGDNPSKGSKSEQLYNGCNDYILTEDLSASLKEFVTTFDDSKMSADSVAKVRAKFVDAFTFYELIGKEQEFITGWDDVKNVAFLDSRIEGTSENRNAYVNMRQNAERYSDMRAWFLGGIIVNHILSAVDAALAARNHNRGLYETETAWYDRIRLDHQFGFETGVIKQSLVAKISF